MARAGSFRRTHPPAPPSVGRSRSSTAHSPAATWWAANTNPQPKHLLKRVLDALGLAPVPDARRKARGQPELLLDAAQHKHARIRRKLPTVEPNTQFLACNRWKIERQESIFAHDGCGTPQSIRESVSQPES